MLARFRLAYVGDPAVLHLPPDRARLAYAIYLGEARDGEELISFEEARQHFRAWSGDGPVLDHQEQRNARRLGRLKPALQSSLRGRGGVVRTADVLGVSSFGAVP